MKKISILILLIICLAGCQKGGNTTTISGEITGLGNDTIYLYGTDGLYERIDTIYVRNDKFSQSLKIDTLISAMLLIKKETEYPVFLDKKEKIKIQGNTNDLNFLTIEGNTYNEDFTAFQEALKGLGAPSDKVLEEKAEAFIRQHNSSLASIYLLNKYFVEKTSPDFSKIKQLIEGMSGNLQDRPFISELEEYINRLSNVVEGKSAPFFSLPNSKGTNISRTEKFSDKYMLISFWASWCEECEQSNTELRKISKQYKTNKDFGMLGISLDVDKEAWKDAIKQDTLSWEQVCNTTGWNSETAKQYAVRKLPTHILVSPTGKIIARDIPNDSLNLKIETVLKKNGKK